MCIGPPGRLRGGRLQPRYPIRPIGRLNELGVLLRPEAGRGTVDLRMKLHPEGLPQLEHLHGADRGGGQQVCTHW